MVYCDKARDSAADKLKDGDLTDETMRKMVVKDLIDIKSKIDCLSLKDLDTSYSFLKEGVELLNLALDQSNEDQKADEATRVINDTASGILNPALSLPQVIQRLKISSDKRFVSAEDCFRKSHEAATYAFNNKSLSIKDGIMACKLRVAARILELGLEDPEAAISVCLSSLKELHGLPAIQEMFAVFLMGRLKSMFNKSERLENVMSVLFINHALYDFANKYGSKSRFLIFAFPGIELEDCTFHPIQNAHEVLRKTSTSGEFFQQLKQVDLCPDFPTGPFYGSFAVNSRGDIILLYSSYIKVIYFTGENKHVMFTDTEKNLLACRGLSVAVDRDDNVYALMKQFQLRSEKKFVLCAFDDKYNIKNVCVLDFLSVHGLLFMKIAVDKYQNFIMATQWNNQVYVCDNTGKLKFQFQQHGGRRSLCISNNNDIMMVSHDFSAVHTYSTDGDLKSTIAVPDAHEAYEVAFHNGICKIIVLTRVKKDDSSFLLTYSETGELENSVLFATKVSVHFNPEMKSHPSGPVAVLYLSRVIFIYEYELFNFCVENRIM